MTSPTLDTYLAADPRRCAHGWALPEQAALHSCDQSEWGIYLAALRASVTPDGYVDRTRLRNAVRGRIFHKHVGQLAKKARDLRLIADDYDQVERSTDVAGRNTHKLEPRLRWLGT